MNVSPEEEDALDRILDDIDKKVEKVCKRATERTGKPPTDKFNSKNIKKTQLAFKAISREIDESKEREAVKISEDEKEMMQRPTVWFKRTAAG